MPFISENELERALVKAAKGPASAPDFYRLLLESDLLVMGTVVGQEAATEKFTLAPGDKINLVTGVRNGGPFLPVFSSLPRMQDYAKQESKFLRVNGRALFDLTRGAPVILNPASEYGKELTPQQISYLLDPSAPQSPVLPVVGPAEYPAALIETLTRVFGSRADIEAAWVLHLHSPGQDRPHPVVGVETAGDWPSLMKAVQAAAETLDQTFDIQRIDRANPVALASTLLQVPPFYQRRKNGPILN